MKVTKGQKEHRWNMLPNWVQDSSFHDPVVHCFVNAWCEFKIKSLEKLFEAIAKTHTERWLNQQENLIAFFGEKPNQEYFKPPKEPTS